MSTIPLKSKLDEYVKLGMVRSQRKGMTMQILMLKGLPAFCIENPLYGIIISMGYVKDLSGNKYNYLKVIERANDRFSPSRA